MNRLYAFLTLGLVAGSAMPVAAQVAPIWEDFAFVSSTMGTNRGRLCAGADGVDLGCPTYAPSLTTAGDVSVTGEVSVTGNLSASKFIGDGSGLTGITTIPDQIVSGTSGISATQSASLTFTTAGSQRMVIGSTGNVGIGTTFLG